MFLILTDKNAPAFVRGQQMWKRLCYLLHICCIIQTVKFANIMDGYMIP